MNADLTKVPKQFCENVLAGHTSEHFVIVMAVGETAQAYALTPAHMKRMVQSLEHQVKEYEEHHGVIDAAWSPGIESPLQKDDIRP